MSRQSIQPSQSTGKYGPGPLCFSTNGTGGNRGWTCDESRGSFSVASVVSCSRKPNGRWGDSRPAWCLTRWHGLLGQPCRKRRVTSIAGRTRPRSETVSTVGRLRGRLPALPRCLPAGSATRTGQQKRSAMPVSAKSTMAVLSAQLFRPI